MQEPEGNIRAIARSAGLPYVDESLHLISRYPLYPAQRGGVRFAYAAIGPRRVVGDHQRPPAIEPLRTRARARRQVRGADARERTRHAVGRDQALHRPLSSLSNGGIPTFLAGDFNTPSHLDEAFPWPVSRALTGAGFRDSYREAWPDAAARPGFTWTAGTPPPRIRKERDARPHRLGARRAARPPPASLLVGERGGPERGLGSQRWGSDHRAVASTFDVRGAPGAGAGGSPTSAWWSVASTVTIRYTSYRGRRIGILPAHGSRPMVTLPIGDSSDHSAGFFGTSPLRPGTLPRRAARRGRAGDRGTSRFWVRQARRTAAHTHGEAGLRAR